LHCALETRWQGFGQFLNDFIYENLNFLHENLDLLMMMMIAFITFKSSLVPLFEGL